MHSLQEIDVGQRNSLTSGQETMTVHFGMFSHLRISMHQKACGIQTLSRLTGSDS